MEPKKPNIPGPPPPPPPPSPGAPRPPEAGKATSTKVLVDLAALALRLRDEQIQAKVVYFGADQKTNKELDAITEAVIAELQSLQREAASGSKRPVADQKNDLEIEQIANLRALLEKLFSERRENFLRRKLETIQRRISGLFFNSELFHKISTESTQARTFAWTDQALYYALALNKDALVASLRSMTFSSPTVLDDTIERLESFEKSLRLEFLHRTTPELERLLTIIVDELSAFLFKDFTRNLGEFCWEVVRESRVGRGKPVGYKLGVDVFQDFRQVFDRKFLEHLVLHVQEPLVRRATAEKDTFREDTVKFVASPEIFSEICSVICDAVYDYLYMEGFLDLPAQWRAHLYRTEAAR